MDVTISERRLAKALPICWRRTAVFFQGVHDHGVLQAVGIAQVGRDRDVDLPGVRDLDAHEAAAPGQLEQPGHLERLRSSSFAISTLDMPSM